MFKTKFKDIVLTFFIIIERSNDESFNFHFKMKAFELFRRDDRNTVESFIMIIWSFVHKSADDKVFIGTSIDSCLDCGSGNPCSVNYHIRRCETLQTDVTIAKFYEQAISSQTNGDREKIGQPKQRKTRINIREKNLVSYIYKYGTGKADEQNPCQFIRTCKSYDTTIQTGCEEQSNIYNNNRNVGIKGLVVGNRFLEER